MVAGGGILSPLRLPLFRSIWTANLIGSTGWLVQGVGAGWLMTTLAGTPEMVALVQTATQAPILLFALLAGALADLWDRRLVLLVAQLWVSMVSAGLALMSGLGLATPTILLLFTFLIGAGAALNGPAWQAVVREIVPKEQLAAAVTLNAIGFNLARALGPAVGGAVVAAYGTEAAFIVNAVGALALVAVLLFWRRELPPDDLPRERLGSAVVTGLRYVGETPAIGAILIRGAVFGFAASAVLALLPLIARDRLGGGPIVYGVLLGAFGIGALLGAFLVHPLRQRRGAEFVITSLGAMGGLAFLALGLAPSRFPLVLAALALAGTSWLGSFSTFNIAVQMSTAFWVQARVLALYQTIVFGAMALGAWIWGEVAGLTSLETAHLAAGALLFLGLAFHWWLPAPAGEAPDLHPATHHEPLPALPDAVEAGPVMVQIEYTVDLADAPAFVAAMDEVGHLRRRNGALRWRLFQDVADDTHWIEAFVLADWVEHQRLRRRMTRADVALEARAVAYHRGKEAPLRRYMVARRHDSRYLLDAAEQGAVAARRAGGG
ncbi:MFS transporter [Benzoatithermus flavus]|uniref:MFS transporter n=1 Tax=Benzoatithermus flavus TaxID=3108223 RepID=A0ABU8XY86_9PROT